MCASASAQASRRSRTGTTSACPRSRRRVCARRHPPTGSSSRRSSKTLAGRCEGVEFESAGELELKGFPEPVEAFSVSWAPLAEETSGAEPLAVAGAASLGAAGLLRGTGRGARWRSRRRWCSRATGRARWCCFPVSRGSARRGFRALRAHRAHAEGFAVCWGACSEELAVPYEPWIEVCSQIVEHAPQELLDSHCRAP